MKWAIRFALSLVFILSSLAFALEPPTRQQLEQYRNDGSLAQRIDNAKALGNHRISPSVLARFQYKLNRLRLEMQGMTPEEIDEIMAPPPAWRGMPTSGTVKILVLLIDFSDYPSSNTAASIQSKLFGDGTASPPYESLRNYYRRSSYNQLEIQGNVLGWYRPSYLRSSIDISPAHETQSRENLIKEALNYYDGQGHDFTQYDNDGDGAIDYLVVIWTGPDNGWANFWWGYMTTFSDSSYHLDGKRLDTYSWQWEANPYPGTFGPLVVIHETGHALGLPDYYDYDPSVGPKGGLGGLDMMDHNWGDHNCFSKFLLDWIHPSTYSTGSSTVTLNASGTSQDAVVIMPGAVAGNEFGEFFMVQNRYRVGNDYNASYPADGLLIWHVDSTLNYIGTDYIYDNSYTSHKLLRLMEADGLEQIEAGGSANAGDYYVAVPGKILGPVSTPNSNRYDGTSTAMSVYDISPTGSSMSFTVSFGLPEINIKQGTMNIPDNTGNFDFGTVNLGSNSSVTFTVESLGIAPLNLTGTPKVQIGGTYASDFVVTTQPSTPVLPGGSTTFVIQFTPGAEGSRSATLSVANDDSDENPYNFTLTGTGRGGQISGNAGVAGTTLSYTDGTPKTATADGSGNYSFTVSYNWSGTVTPSKTGYTFSPTSRTYSNVTSDQTSHNYTATAITYTISGNAGVAGATLSYTDGTPKTATADGSGNYSFTVSYNWSGTVTPTKTGYTFSPTSRTYSNVTSDQTSQNYTATAITYTISGNAGVAGATLSYTDGTPKTATADGSGNYSFTVSYNWSGTVTPTKTGYTFSPVNRTYTNVLSNQTNQNYTATLQVFTISGYVRTAGAVGISGVLMSGLPGNPTTDATGYYSGWVDYNWSGTVTPTRAGVSFSPASTPYSNVTSNQSQNYTGTKTVTRLDIDKKIKDFKAGTATEQEVKDPINSYVEVPE